MSSIPLTRRQRDIVTFFERYQQEHAISPTLEEIAQHLGVNKVTVFGHVAELERKGVLAKRVRRASRSLELIASTERSSEEDAVGRPRIVGTIAAGQPLETLETSEPLSIPGCDARVPHQRYCLRVRGNSMIDDHICDGDIVVIEKRPHVNDGDTVVAVLPGEVATLKRLYREAGGFRLQPANDVVESFFVPAGELEIRGVMVGLIREPRS